MLVAAAAAIARAAPSLAAAALGASVRPAAVAARPFAAFAASGPALARAAAVARPAAKAGCSPSGGSLLVRLRPAVAPAGLGSLRVRFASSAAAPVASVAPRSVGLWLLSTAGLIFGMVVLGGLTRLTRSGLSMVDWKFTGEPLPRTDDEWEREFAKYQAFPEYQVVNTDMTLDEFKFIFGMEWSHRMLGRAIGFAFAVPLAYFAIRGRIGAPLARRLGVILALGAGQGFLGWYMVKSGLEEEHITDKPSVSPYRLASHLLSAFFLYSAVLWTSMDILRGPQSAAVGPAHQLAKLRKYRGMTIGGAVLVAITVASGAFVAGLEAGKIYNEFPLMGGRVVPSEYSVIEDSFLRNAFENPAAAQFHHRVLAIATFLKAVSLWAVARKTTLLPPQAKTAAALVAGMATVQASLGITALLEHVPVSIGSAHQAGSLTLLSLMLYLLHCTPRVPKGALRAAAKQAAAAA